MVDYEGLCRFPKSYEGSWTVMKPIRVRVRVRVRVRSPMKGHGQ